MSESPDPEEVLEENSSAEEVFNITPPRDKYPYRYEWNTAAGEPLLMTAWMHPDTYGEPDPEAWANRKDASSVFVVYAHRPKQRVLEWNVAKGLIEHTDD